jgi:ribose transport system ATP-binding protein
VSDADPLLQVRDLTKSFGASRALNGVSFDLARGEVHALVGENGAGKSTLTKILSGALRPDSGAMTLAGERYAPRGPKDALRKGVAMIYQELALAPHLTVEANVMLGQERTLGGFLRLGEHRRKVREALALLDHPEIDPDRVVGTLSVGAQQLVEVARALVSSSRVIIFDEPTSSLTEHDAERLFAMIRRLRTRGIAVVYISHFLEEVQAVAQRYTVLRDGVAVATAPMEGAERRTIIAQMVGREIDDFFPRVQHQPGETVLELSALRGRRRFPARASLSIRRGEVLGIAGLVGSGRTELLRAVFGLDPVVSGQVVVKGFSSAQASPRSRISQGLGFVSEDRKAEGLALERSIEDNMTYPALRRHARWGWLRLGQRRAEVGRLIDQVGVRCRGPAQRVGALSGGNQQKVALARLLHQRADVLLLDDPTRGIDVGSKAEVYRLIGELASRGVAVVMVSSYLPELFGVCDRLAVMCRGVMSEARPVAEWDEHAVLAAATAS